MRLSSLYSNQSEIFGPIHFERGLNVVLGEIRLPNSAKDNVHNLGKTTLARVIDFCLGSGVSNSFFLLKHKEIFAEFVCSNERQLLDGNYVTIRRSVSSASKLSIVKHSAPRQDYSEENDEVWDHKDLGFTLGKQVLEGLFNLTATKPGDFGNQVVI